VQQALPFSFHSLGSHRNLLNYLAEESIEVRNPTFAILRANIWLLYTRYHAALPLQLCFNRKKESRYQGCLAGNSLSDIDLRTSVLPKL